MRLRHSSRICAGIEARNRRNRRRCGRVDAEISFLAGVSGLQFDGVPGSVVDSYVRGLR